MINVKIILLVIVAIVLVGGGTKLIIRGAGRQNVTGPNPDQNSKQETSVKLIGPEQFAQLATDERAFVVDVHIPEQTHIPGTDAFIPYDRIQEEIDQLPEDKSTPILVYCRSGGMSETASREIAALGYTNVYDLEGGTNAFKQEQASVSFWPEKKDLGTVIYGEVEKTSYTLTNYTSRPLKVTRVSTSCGCTKARVEKEELGAYESTTVNVSFDPAVHKDDTDLEELTRTIYIETDNPNFPELEAIFTANVIKKEV